MTKKEFKKKCKEEKTTSYKLMLFGTISSSVGLAIVIAIFLLVKNFDAQIIGFVIGGLFAIAGIVLDATGEAILAKDFKEYKQS